MPKALSLCGNRIQRRAGLCGAPVGGALSFCLRFSFNGFVLRHQPNVNAIRSGDKQFFGVAAPEAAGPGGDAGVIAGLMTALLRPVVLRCRRAALRLAFCA